jgi:hypothetical protein
VGNFIRIGPGIEEGELARVVDWWYPDRPPAQASLRAWSLESVYNGVQQPVLYLWAAQKEFV